MDDDVVVKHLREQLQAEKARADKYHAALTKISAIRDSIVGMQGFNFSEHAYPLVAALDEAGFEGVGYVIASKNLGTLIEQRDVAERARAEALVIIRDAVRMREFQTSLKGYTEAVVAKLNLRQQLAELRARAIKLREVANSMMVGATHGPMNRPTTADAAKVNEEIHEMMDHGLSAEYERTGPWRCMDCEGENNEDSNKVVHTRHRNGRRDCVLAEFEDLRPQEK